LISRVESMRSCASLSSARFDSFGRVAKLHRLVGDTGHVLIYIRLVMAERVLAAMKTMHRMFSLCVRCVAIGSSNRRGGSTGGLHS
jgi:hypothetical protein